jgi:hypothetical protein
MAKTISAEYHDADLLKQAIASKMGAHERCWMAARLYRVAGRINIEARR